MLSLLLGLSGQLWAQSNTFTIGSKRFTESYILGEVIARIARQTDETKVVLRSGLGNTGILLAALKAGEIDIYPEYTGTITREILHSPAALDLEQINVLLEPMGLSASIVFGFNNTYALAMREELAEQLNIRSISDLKQHPHLRFGLTQEFIGRQDGWPGLKSLYGLGQTTPRGIDHGLVYQAIEAEQLDVMDAYTTDAMLKRYPLRILRDDLGYFPAYDALLLYRSDVPTRFPRTWRALQTLQNAVSAPAMIAMNSQAEQEKIGFARIAQDFLTKEKGPGNSRHFLGLLFADDFWRLLGEHARLVFVSLALSILCGIPLGVLCFEMPFFKQLVLSSVSVINTIPSLALFALFIPLLGMIGAAPAICALVLYGLLPIVRNTYSGLSDIPGDIQETTRMLGLGRAYRLYRIELPMSSRSILSGIKTSAVLNVGTATIAAFIGAGGFGERIAQGLALNDNAMLLTGAIPAAVFALLVHASFELSEKWLVPKGLRLSAKHAMSGMPADD